MRVAAEFSLELGAEKDAELHVRDEELGPVRRQKTQRAPGHVGRPEDEVEDEAAERARVLAQGDGLDVRQREEAVDGDLGAGGEPVVDRNTRLAEEAKGFLADQAARLACGPRHLDAVRRLLDRRDEELHMQSSDGPLNLGGDLPLECILLVLLLVDVAAGGGVVVVVVDRSALLCRRLSLLRLLLLLLLLSLLFLFAVALVLLGLGLTAGGDVPGAGRGVLGAGSDVCGAGAIVPSGAAGGAPGAGRAGDLQQAEEGPFEDTVKPGLLPRLRAVFLVADRGRRHHRSQVDVGREPRLLRHQLADALEAERGAAVAARRPRAPSQAPARAAHLARQDGPDQPVQNVRGEAERRVHEQGAEVLRGGGQAARVVVGAALELLEERDAVGEEGFAAFFVGKVVRDQRLRRHGATGHQVHRRDE